MISKRELISQIARANAEIRDLSGKVKDLTQVAIKKDLKITKLRNQLKRAQAKVKALKGIVGVLRYKVGSTIGRVAQLEKAQRDTIDRIAQLEKASETDGDSQQADVTAAREELYDLADSYEEFLRWVDVEPRPRPKTLIREKAEEPTAESTATEPPDPIMKRVKAVVEKGVAEGKYIDNSSPDLMTIEEHNKQLCRELERTFPVSTSAEECDVQCAKGRPCPKGYEVW